MKLLSPVDAMFWRMESDRTPMHIGALATFRMPPGAGPDFVRTIHRSFAGLEAIPFPFDSRVTGLVGGLVPAWERADVDAEHHVHLSAVPRPGGERELGELVQRLHSTPLDPTRPLWEAHVIEGLADNRFAFYFKAHHCAVDGMGAVDVVRHWLTTAPGESGDLAEVPGLQDDGRNRVDTLARSTWERTAQGIQAAAEVGSKIVGMAFGSNSHLRAALATPRTPFNTRITRHRRIAMQSLPLAQLRAVARATGTTVNDVVLASLGGAVRRYLEEYDALPDADVTASIPVGFDREPETINAATGFVCPLGTATADPLQRLERVHAVSTRGKGELLDMSPNALQHYTLVGLLPLVVGQRTGALQKLPPLFNFTVSNILLSKDRLFLDGAELESMVPVSFLCDGYGLNVTLVGYTDTVTLGIIGCRDTVPHLQRLAPYTQQALDELAEAAGI